MLMRNGKSCIYDIDIFDKMCRYRYTVTNLNQLIYLVHFVC